MKVCWLWYYYYKWKFHPYIHHWIPLTPVMEHYSEEHLLLQRSILSLCYGEVKTLHNTPKPFLILSLTKSLAFKSPFYELWGSIYNKGWANPWHSLCDSLISWLINYFTKWHIPLHDEFSYSNIDTWNFTYNIFTNNITFSTCTHVRQNRLETS